MVGLSYIQNSLLLMLATLLLHLEISSCKPFGNNNGKCIRNTWVCDSEDDCGDKSDESQTDGALCGKFNYFFPTMVCIFIRNLVCLLVYACTCVIACLCVCVCVCVCLCVCMCVWMWVCLCLCVLISFHGKCFSWMKKMIKYFVRVQPSDVMLWR